jgi:hypothetical protein
MQVGQIENAPDDDTDLTQPNGDVSPRRAASRRQIRALLALLLTRNGDTLDQARVRTDSARTLSTPIPIRTRSADGAGD